MMNNKNMITAVIVLIAVLAQTVQAEYRIWTDSDGTKLEAELMESVNGLVTLRNKEGKEGSLSISKLSPDDQKYVLRATPPDIDISVNEVTDRKNTGFGGDYGSGFQIAYGTVVYKAKLTKKSSIPFSKEITAELYIIGKLEVKGQYGVLNKTVETFSFDSRGSDKYEFSSNPINMKQFEAGGGKAGAQYEGYLVVLVDENGRVFQTKASRSKIKEHVEIIRNKKQGDFIDQDNLLPLRGGRGGPDTRPARNRK
jgi:hypothetical protein